ncbi:MAG: type II toxin-antitoxin system RelE/ParE family toxin [Chitinophagaceae bacterium]|nr:type II toxin-antitoxin system RelE/ParE family toxin [Chitinophagaceae bacterium]
MAYRLVILKAAAEDTKDAYDYYEKIQPGLGDRFLSEVLIRFNEISKHPQYYGFIDSQNIIRDIKLKSFPYLVVYEIAEDQVIIYSVHCGYKLPDQKFRK